MAIAASDLEYRYSAPAASGGNEQSQTDPAASIGKWLSKSVWAGGSLHDLFGVISGDDNANLVSEYRCLFFVNKHASLTLTDAVAWFTSEVSGGAQHALGVDPTAASPVNGDTQQALSVADENSAPMGVAFSTPTSKGTGVALGNIGPGQCKAFWLRRTAQNSAALDSDGFSIRVEGDTAA